MQLPVFPAPKTTQNARSEQRAKLLAPKAAAKLHNTLLQVMITGSFGSGNKGLDTGFVKIAL